MDIKLLIIFIAFIIVAAFLVRTHIKGKRQAEEEYQKALKLEKEGQYQKSCYNFAFASMLGAKNDKCYPKIKALWEKHGPFDFNEELEEIVKECSCGYTSCAQGYHAGPLKEIEKALKTK